MALSTIGKRVMNIFLDGLLIPLALFLAFYLQYDWQQSLLHSRELLILLIPLSLLGFHWIGVYRNIVRYMGYDAVIILLKSVALSVLILFLSMRVFSEQLQPVTIMLYGSWLLLLVGGSRFLVWHYHKNKDAGSKEHILIYGAGEAGRLLINAVSHHHRYRIVGFIDDNEALKGQVIHGVRVYHRSQIKELIQRQSVALILLAMPGTQRVQKKKIIQFLEPLPVQVKTIPTLEEIISGRSRIDEIKELEIEDLLGRDSVMAQQKLLQQCITGKVVLVTGAGGTIGAELCRQIGQLSPALLLMLEASEFALYQIGQELQQSGQQVRRICLLGSVQDSKQIEVIIQSFQVQTIYHAAAYKHVPLVEENVVAGIRNNVFGTETLAKIALAHQVETFVLISTDKAVRPTNIMGASKRLAEMVLQSLTADSKLPADTRFCMVRFGNVLGSSGSVVPLFKQQIHSGGPLTVTHPEITRFFMTIPEAVQLVIQAGAMGKGGDVFVLDMGEPVKIVDLAKRMIHLSGLELKDDAHPDGDIEIKYTGLRPGEKLYEELLIGENVSGTEHPAIMKAQEHYIEATQLRPLLDALRQACDAYDVQKISELLSHPLIGYQPTDAVINDLIWRAQHEQK